MPDRYDAVIVGSGPNGLAAAITIAREGYSVAVLEAADSIGGGMRSRELTLPGFTHDVCSAIHPLVLASPFFKNLRLGDYGVEVVHPEVPLAQPLDDGSAAVLYRSVDETATALGRDAGAYRRLMEPLVRRADGLAFELLGPLRFPRYPRALTSFAPRAMWSATRLCSALFREERASSLVAGLAAHSMLRLDQFPTAAVSLVLGVFAHAYGWPAIRGGTNRLADALGAHLLSLGGTIETSRRVQSMADVPPARALLFDLTPRQLVDIAGSDLPSSYSRRLKKYRYGPGVFKVDHALDGPIPWKADDCARAGTVHVAGTDKEVAASEAEVDAGRHPDRPYVLLAQQSMFDPSRAPDGHHTAWSYCHVPNGSSVDMTERMEAQIERFAPGFRDRIIGRSTMNATEVQSYNSNYVGGDINGGVQDFRQLFTRPTLRFPPYTTPNPRIYMCSSSTPPGGGVHGMCGYFAAMTALRRALR